MADEVPANQHEAFILQTASLGPIRCGRIRVSDAMRTAEEAGNDAPPDQTVRALFRQVGRRADGSRFSPEEVAAVPPPEMEEFARQILATHPHLYRKHKMEKAAEGGTRIIRDEFEEPFLNQEGGESSVDFLARALDHRANRIGATLAAKAGSIAGLSSLAGFATGAALTASLTHTAALARAALTPQLGGLARSGAKTATVVAEPISDTVMSALADMPTKSATALATLQHRIDEFTVDLEEDQQVELVSASAPGGVSFYIQEREAASAEMISLKGFGPDARPIEIVQHYTQLNITLMAVPKNAEARRFGFVHPNDDF